MERRPFGQLDSPGNRGNNIPRPPFSQMSASSSSSSSAAPAGVKHKTTTRENTTNLQGRLLIGALSILVIQKKMHGVRQCAAK
mmetsp:Transcript_42181/g.83032  ORF Transcript_42181/g.83032 Transcript_42181/m.83032 type:complete len:83 (-) Transcript_42181:6-254(-)